MADRAGSRPEMNEALASEFLVRHYGLLVAPTDITTLVGYEDRNFRVAPNRLCSTGHVLKVANHVDSARPAGLQAQNDVMAHVAASGITCPQPVMCGSGENIAFVDLVAPSGGTTRHVLRLLEYVPGRLLEEAAQSAGLCAKLGTFLARLNASLAGFCSGELETRCHDWAPHLSADVITKGEHAFEGDPAKLAHVRRAAAALREGAEQHGAELRRCIVHTDANEANLIVSDDDADVAGVIDFGDAMVDWTCADPAIAMAYLMLLQIDRRSQGRQYIDPFEAGRALLRAYVAEYPLNDAELQMVPAMLQARVAQSLTNGAVAARMDSSNSEYLLKTQAPGWELMGILGELSQKDLLAAFTS